MGQSRKSSWRKWHLHRALKNREEEVGSDWQPDRAFFWMRDILLHSVINSHLSSTCLYKPGTENPLLPPKVSGDTFHCHNEARVGCVYATGI